MFGENCFDSSFISCLDLNGYSSNLLNLFTEINLCGLLLPS
jgi:hypothetical protein